MFEAEPEGWVRLRLGDLFQERKERGQQGLPIASVSIDSGLVPRSSLDRRVTSELADEDHALVRKDDIVYNMMRMWQGACGRARSECLVSPAYVVMTPLSRVDPIFSEYLLRSPAVIRLLHAYSHGVVDDRLRLYPDAFGRIPVSVPSLEEQQRIAKVLRSVDEAITTARAVAEATRRSSHTMRHELLHVSADGEIGELPADWEIRPLEALATVERGRFSIRPRNDPRYFGGSTPFIQTGDITAAGDFLTSHTQTLNELGVAVSRVFPAGTIMTTIAANIGDFTITTYPVACPDSVVGIEAGDDVDRFWLYSILSCFKVALDKAATQNAQKNINLQTLRPLLIPVPPSSVMTELAETLEAAAKAARDADKACQSLASLKRTVMDDLLTGRVRVPA
jgi:type I restriction enzyme S subunit